MLLARRAQAVCCWKAAAHREHSKSTAISIAVQRVVAACRGAAVWPARAYEIKTKNWPMETKFHSKWLLSHLKMVIANVLLSKTFYLNEKSCWKFHSFRFGHTDTMQAGRQAGRQAGAPTCLRARLPACLPALYQCGQTNNPTPRLALLMTKIDFLHNLLAHKTMTDVPLSF